MQSTCLFVCPVNQNVLFQSVREPAVSASQPPSSRAISTVISTSVNQSVRRSVNRYSVNTWISIIYWSQSVSVSVRQSPTKLTTPSFMWSTNLLVGKPLSKWINIYRQSTYTSLSCSPAVDSVRYDFFAHSYWVSQVISQWMRHSQWSLY